MRHVLFAGVVWLWMVGRAPATSRSAGATATPPVLPSPTATRALAPPTSDTTSGSAPSHLAAAILATPAAPPPDPGTYLEDGLAWIELHALRRDRIDWPSTLAQARAVASGAHTSADTYPAMRLVLASLNDRHSFLLESEQAADWLRDPGNQDPEARRLDNGIGYVALPGFIAFDEQTATASAIRVQELIRAVDQPPACGWIVDVRQNGGGFKWPMLARIGPLLGGRGWCDRFIEPARSVVLPGWGSLCRRPVGDAGEQP